MVPSLKYISQSSKIKYTILRSHESFAFYLLAGYPVEKRIAIKKEMVQPKDSGVTLEEESNTIPELSKFPAHSKKSFFRRNNNSKYAAHGK